MSKKRQTAYRKHSRRRLEERYTETSLTADEINKLINAKSFIYAKRFSESRSVIYILVPNSEEVIKAVINRKTKQIVTYLPMDYPFVIDPITVETERKKYVIILFPDMYKLTGNMNTSCEFYESDLENGQLVRIDKENINTYDFDVVFKAAWKIFLEDFDKGKEDSK